MTKIKIIIVSLALLCVSTSNVWAQENTTPKAFEISPSNTANEFTPPPPNFKPGEETKDNSSIVATAEINNAKIVSQDGNKLKISFDLYNKEKIQPGIRYGLKLVYPENGFLAATEKVYDEVLNLGSGETIKKEIDFTAPKSLGGRYNLLLSAQNDKGLVVAMKYVGETTFQGGTDNSVEIVASSCYLNVEGTDKKYTLDQGVDISANENMTLNCEAKNNFDQEVRVTPNFKTYYRTIYGKLIRAEDKNQLILPAKEKKSFSISIPKEQKPQAYDLLLTLFDSNKKEISNSIRIHYVVQGISATVFGTRLDRDYYSKGDSAQVAILWTGSADAFYGSRKEKAGNDEINLAASIMSSSGSVCSEPYSEKLETTKRDGQKFLSIPIIKDCLDPKVQIAIKDKNGNVLDQAEYIIKSKQSPQAPQSISVWTLKNIIFGLAILLIVVIAIVVIIKKRSQKINNFSILIILFLGSFVFSVDKVEAVAWVSSPSAYCAAQGDSSATYNASLDAASYAPGQTIAISAWASSWATCANSDYVSAVQYHSYYWNPSFGWQLIGNETIYSASVYGGNPWGTLYRAAPSTPGYYVVNFTGLVYGADSVGYNCHLQGWGSGTGSISFNVIAPPTVSISAAPNPVARGGTTVLNVNSTNSPTWCTISGGQYSNTPCGGAGQVYPVALTNATTYTFTCGNASGQASAAVTVGVSVPTAALSANPNPVPYNGTTTLTWSSANTTNCWMWDDTQTEINGWTGSASGTRQTINLTAYRGYHVQCYNSFGYYAQADLPVNVGVAPTATLSASPSSIISGNYSTLTWSSTNATNCWMWDDTQTEVNGWVGTSGSRQTTNLTATRGYHVECYNAANYVSPRADATVSVCTPTYACQTISDGDCTGEICGTPVTKQYICQRTCGGVTATVSKSECTSRGIACPADENLTCPACDDSKWKEVSP